MSAEQAGEELAWLLGPAAERAGSLLGVVQSSTRANEHRIAEGEGAQRQRVAELEEEVRELERRLASCQQQNEAAHAALRRDLPAPTRRSTRPRCSRPSWESSSILIGADRFVLLLE